MKRSRDESKSRNDLSNAKTQKLKDERVIVLFASAHGEQKLDEINVRSSGDRTIPSISRTANSKSHWYKRKQPSRAKTVSKRTHNSPKEANHIDLEVLSFVPFYGKYGYFRGVAFEASSDSVLEIAIDNVYLTLQEKPINTFENLKYVFYNVLPRTLKSLYLHLFAHDHNVQKNFRYGMTIVEPKYDRVFSFKPNPREPLTHYNHYGLHIVDVLGLDKIPNLDKLFTPFRSVMRPSYTFDTGNISNKEGLKMTSIDIRQNIQTMFAAIKTIKDQELRKRCYLIYTKLINTSENENASTIKLSEIYLLFKSIGFTKIYLIDPSCRYISDENYEIIRNDSQTRELQERSAIGEVTFTSTKYCDNELQSSPVLTDRDSFYFLSEERESVSSNSAVDEFPSADKLTPSPLEEPDDLRNATRTSPSQPHSTPNKGALGRLANLFGIWTGAEDSSVVGREGRFATGSSTATGRK